MERAYRIAEALGIAVWCEDEAGPFQMVPYAASSWQQQEHPQKQPHEYIRNGTAKLMTLFHPHDGQVRVKGIESTTNVVLLAWLKQELTEIVNALPPASSSLSPELTQQMWLAGSGACIHSVLPLQPVPFNSTIHANRPTSLLLKFFCTF